MRRLFWLAPLLVAGLVFASAPARADLEFSDIACETSTTAGTGTLDLAGALTGGYLGFAAAGIDSGDTVPYHIKNGSQLETGIGTFTDASPDTLARTTVKWSTDGAGTALTLSGSSTVCIGPIASVLMPGIATSPVAMTWGSGSASTITWTFDAGATDPVLTAASGSLALTNAKFLVGSPTAETVTEVGASGSIFSTATVGGITHENTQASSSTNGGFLRAYSNDGANMASGDRLGAVLLGGLGNGAIRNSAAISAYASETYTASYGATMEFQLIPTGGTSRATEAILSDTNFTPGTDGGNSLGSATVGWQNLFRNTGFVDNWENGDCLLTHSSNTLALTGGCTITSDSNLSLGTTGVLSTGTIELGHASDTTVARSAAGEATLEGDAIKHAGRQTIGLQAGGGTLPSGGAIAACTPVTAFDSGSNDVFLRQCSFSASTDNAIYYTFFFPKGAAEGTDLVAQVDWTSATTTDATDDVIWTASAVCFSNDDAINGNAFPAVDTVTDTQTAAGDYLVSGEITAITPAGSPTEGDGCVIRFTRDADAAGDNFNGTAELIQVRLYYVDSASSDD